MPVQIALTISVIMPSAIRRQSMCLWPCGSRQPEEALKKGPSRKEWEEGVREFRQEAETTWSLTSSEHRDMRQDYSCQPGERIAAWLLRCWGNRAGSQQLEGRGAQQLGSLARTRGIERGMGKEAASCSLWRRLLSSVRARYPSIQGRSCELPREVDYRR